MRDLEKDVRLGGSSRLQRISQMEIKEWKFYVRGNTLAKKQKQENSSGWLEHERKEEKIEEKTKNILSDLILGKVADLNDRSGAKCREPQMTGFTIGQGRH